MANLITPVGTLSYPNLWEPREGFMGGPAKYSCAVVFAPDTDLTELKRATIACAKEKWGERAEAMIRNGKLRMPFRTDGEEKGYEPGSTFINVRTNTAPGIVSIIPDPNTGRPMKITDESAIYPGAQVKVSLQVFSYDTNGNKGVSFNLANVQKVADGPRLDGRIAADLEFEADPNAAADLSDLETPVEDNDLSELL
jgi:hypothetical protein